jgi:hypothetical protein
MVQIVMFDPPLIALAQEIQNHPKLVQRMKQAELEGKNAHATIFTLKQDDDIPVINNFSDSIGFLAAEAGILLHGEYSYEDILGVCDKIREALIEKRTVIVNTVNSKSIGESASRTESRIIMQSDYKH